MLHSDVSVCESVGKFWIPQVLMHPLFT